MPKLQQQQLTRRVLPLVLLSVALLLLLSSSRGVVEVAAYQRSRVYEQRSAQYVNPAVVRQQLEQRKRNAELAWQKRLVEIARIRSDAEQRARELARRRVFS